MSRKTQHYTKALVAIGIIAVMLLSQGIGALSAEPINVQVATFEELVTAIANASDGDTIEITGNIQIPYLSTIGDATKQITLKKVNGNGYFTFNGDDFTGSYTIVENITFDGNNISNYSSFLSINHGVSFSNTRFINCNNIVDGGAISINGGEVRFNYCTFSSNNARHGAHIYNGSNRTVYIDNSTFSNGSASENGGALFNNGASSTLQISNTTITGNTAGFYGGGIYNAGSLTATNTKIYSNTATKGGSDIYNTGTKSLDSIETLTALFSEDSISPIGWISDIEGGSVDTYLKLDYEVITPTPDPTPEPTPTEEPTPEPTEEPTPPIEEPTPEPTEEPTPIPEDPTEPTIAPDPEEEPTITPTPEPTENPTPIPEVEDPTPTEEPEPEPTTTPTEAPTSTPTPEPTSKPIDHSSNNDNSYKEDPTPTPTVTPTVTPSPTVKPTPKPTATPKPEATVKPTKAPEIVKEDKVITQSIKESSKPITVEPTATPKEEPEEQIEDPVEVTPTPTEDPIEVLGTALQDKNIKIDAKGVDLIFEVTDEGYNISINANKAEEEIQPVIAQQDPTPTTTSNDPNWVEVATLIVLAMFTITQFIKAKKA